MACGQVFVLYNKDGDLRLKIFWVFRDSLCVPIKKIRYENALYHITCRGNERKSIFKDDHDKKVFLELLSDA